MIKRKILFVLGTLGLLLATPLAMPTDSLAQGSRTFPETGKTVSGRFLEYWNANGGLAQQGFPISEEMEEISNVDGQTYTIQYFERAVFELHPENDAPYDVLLSLLGNFNYNDRYDGNAPGQKASTTTPRRFMETGKTIGGKFRTYWEKNGGLAQQGFPISNEFREVSDTDGKEYTVQYFERAVFELHPEKAGTPYEVQLSLLGVYFHTQKHGVGGGPSLLPRRTPTPGTSPSAQDSDLFKPDWTHIAASTNNVVLFYDEVDGSATTARIADDGVLTPLQKFAGSSEDVPILPDDATHLLAGPNDLFYLYDEESGTATVANVKDDGSLTNIRTEQWKVGWTAIGIDTETGLGAFHSKSSDLLETARMNSDGSMTILDSSIFIGKNVPGLSHLVPLGDGRWLAYGVVNDRGTAVTLALNEDGEVTMLKAIGSFSSTWTHVVSDNSIVLFYNKANGAALTGDIKADGAFNELMKFSDWQGIWDPVITTRNGVSLFYDTSTGQISTDRFNADGNYTHLMSYAQARSERDFVKPGWTHIVATTNDVVFFYNATQPEPSTSPAGATARISDDGVLTSLRAFPGDNPGYDNLYSTISHYVAGPEHSLLAYQQNGGGGRVLDVRDDGTIFDYNEGMAYGKWSHVVTDPETGLGVFYSVETGQLATVRWNADDPGNFRNLDAGAPAGPNEPRWKHIVPVGNGNWFLSSETPGNFRAIVAYGNSAGQFVLQDDIPGFQGGWTHVVAADSRMLFYNQNEGTALAAEVNANGQFKVLQSYEFWPTTWEVYATQNGLFIFYDRVAAVISIERMDESGNMIQLNDYQR